MTVHNGREYRNMRFTQDELSFLSWALRELSDYACWDDRPDHGLARLALLRDNDNKDQRETLFKLMGRFSRMARGEKQ